MKAALVFLLAALAIAAVVARLGSDKSLPGTISAGFNAFTNVFRGAFDR